MEDVRSETQSERYGMAGEFPGGKKEDEDANL